MSIDCTWEQFKHMAKEFHDAAPSLRGDELDNAWKCLGLGYLGMNDPAWESSAAILLKMEGRHYMTCCAAPASTHPIEQPASVNLPELPEPDYSHEDGTDEYGYATYGHAYTADQMQDYARAALASAKERT